MCYHKFYIFATCGHSFWQPGPPLVPCRRAASSSSSAGGCQPQSHPYQTRKIYELCWACRRRRDARLVEAEKRVGAVRFEEWKWRMKYQAPRAEENAWKTWGDGEAAAAAAEAGGGGGRSIWGSRGSRMGRMSDMLKAGWRKSGGGGGGGGV